MSLLAAPTASPLGHFSVPELQCVLHLPRLFRPLGANRLAGTSWVLAKCFRIKRSHLRG